MPQNGIFCLKSSKNDRRRGLRERVDLTSPLKLSIKFVKHLKTISQFARVFSTLAAILTELWTFLVGDFRKFEIKKLTPV